MAKLPFKKRMLDALHKFGISNGNKIDDGVPPADINDKDAWQLKHAAIRDALRYKLMKDVGEKSYEDAKARILAAFEIDKTKLGAGYDETLVTDNVACNIRIQNGRAMLNKDKLLVVLTTQYKLSMEDALGAIDKSTVVTAPAVYFTPSLVRE